MTQKNQSDLKLNIKEIQEQTKQSLKAQYDLNNIFSYAQSIPSESNFTKNRKHASKGDCL